MSAAGIASAMIVALRFGHANAQSKPAPASLPHLSETDPLAQGLGYKADAHKVDKARFPTYKEGQTCGKCRFYQGASGQAYGPCQIFAGKSVNANGWCVSFNLRS